MNPSIVFVFVIWYMYFELVFYIEAGAQARDAGMSLEAVPVVSAETGPEAAPELRS